MAHSDRVISLHLLQSGNVEIEDSFSCEDAKLYFRFCALVQGWDDPVIQKRLDEIAAADMGESAYDGNFS